ncbi:hypothetical protein RU639_001853 [Aspergillus parasiticus]
MRLSLALPFLACLSLAVSAEIFHCPEEDVAATKCAGPKDCLYPEPYNCDQFIRCEVNDDGITIQAITKDCPVGLEWNDKKKECVWPKDSTCGL